ncbi:hypothetical protein [Tabrizicola aquatica]|uniref:hypothetical protein n=1 Tax=Tabrizicola aquatica TaxID=909926 RepID=UPI0011AFB0E7|nr:hypothetical protein [Tabrizicola aquatica]
MLRLVTVLLLVAGPASAECLHGCLARQKAILSTVGFLVVLAVIGVIGVIASRRQKRQDQTEEQKTDL